MLVEVSIEQEQASLSCAIREQGAGLSINPEAEGMSFTQFALLCVVTVESLALAILWCRARCCVRRRTYRQVDGRAEPDNLFTAPKQRESAIRAFTGVPSWSLGTVRLKYF